MSIAGEEKKAFQRLDAVLLNSGIGQLRCEIALTVRDMRKPRVRIQIPSGSRRIGGDERLGYGFNTTESIKVRNRPSAKFNCGHLAGVLDGLDSTM
jgi:hypothetical protein